MSESDGGGEEEGITIGGPMPWFSVSLSIAADGLDPDAVTRLLGVAPDTARWRGERWPVAAGGLSSAPARIGLWLIRLRPEQAPGCDVEAAIVRLLDRIATVPGEAWRRACAGAHARIFVGLTLDTDNRGFRLGPALLRRVAELGLDLDLDIYNGVDDEPQDGTSAPG